MPAKNNDQTGEKAKRTGKAPSTQAGEFVRGEIEGIRQGKHGARGQEENLGRTLCGRQKGGAHKGKEGLVKAARTRAAHA